MGLQPKEVLRVWADEVPRAGRALDLAAGEGRTAAWLARRGLAVDAVDISAVGLAKARALLDAAGPAVASRVRLIPWDLDLGLPPECLGPYDVMTVIHYRDPELVVAALERLGPGGVLLIECLSDPEGSGGGFRAAPGELPSVARRVGLEVVAHEELRTDHGAVVRMLARRPAPVTVEP